jgi:MFS family permease
VTSMTHTELSPFAPLRELGFRWLWPAVVVSYIGAWMQTVGAQWLLVNGPNASLTVSLIQTAATLPIMLFALPAGVLADRFDRRRVMIAAQAYIVVIALALATLSFAGFTSPMLVLTLTFLLGVGGAVQQPTWQATLPEVVPRPQLGNATRLEMVGVNFGRSAGPAVAGILIALAGVPWVFLLNAFTAVVLALAFLTWPRAPRPNQTLDRERFVPALRAGLRYVRHEPPVRRILIRAVMYIAPATVLWALLPIVARERLGVGAAEYGALFAALGVGAILAALTVGYIRQRVSTNALITVATLITAAGLTLIVLLPNLAVAIGLLVGIGASWTTVVSTLNAELQLSLPAWVRARGLAIYLVTFTGSQAAASVIWGQVSTWLGVTFAYVLGAALLAVGAAVGSVLRVAEMGPLDPEPAAYWTDAVLSVDLAPSDGPIVVTVEYDIAAEDEAAFLTAMLAMRRSRRRSGAFRWGIAREAEHPNVFVESFSVGSWSEHLRQHDGRLTSIDREIESEALKYSRTPVRVRHLVPPTIPTRTNRDADVTDQS